MLSPTADYNTSDALELLVCKHCNQPISKTAIIEHIKSCIEEKQSTAQKTPVPGIPDEDSTGKNDEGDKKRKKDDKEPKKKKAKIAAAGGKGKGEFKGTFNLTTNLVGPVDIEKQCGVPLPQGGLCARSLTCKSHSMGAKRAVEGRSQPYDTLLTAYQKRKQVRVTKPSTASHKAGAGGTRAGGKGDPGEAPVDSEEEVISVMAGIKYSAAYPLADRVIMPVKRKRRFWRMREMLYGALGSTRSGSNAGGQMLGKVLNVSPTK